MHTLFTVAVYGALGLGSRYNCHSWVIAAKLVACTLVVAAVWEQRSVFYALWGFSQPILGYIDPRRPGVDPLHGMPPFFYLLVVPFAFAHARSAVSARGVVCTECSCSGHLSHAWQCMRQIFQSRL